MTFLNVQTSVIYVKNVFKYKLGVADNGQFNW